ncbi:hypothetical protein BKA69DRAFT_1065291 [Paraphysoderma sedebokerense]|nr:hypothetical protein BKA69DRAFT_1065158 [Paraphysoderma sedebokerense]KAI9142900.1 hypothetical protein BKA69DRAFT_1065291 [Paraphysoderma sedebokerense]
MNSKSLSNKCLPHTRLHSPTKQDDTADDCHQQTHFTIPILPELQTVSFPIFSFSSWKFNFRTIELEEKSLLPKEFLANAKTELDAIMGSPLIIIIRAIMLAMFALFIAIVAIVPLTFKLDLPSIYLQLICIFTFISIFTFIGLNVMLFRRLNLFCESITQQFSRIYGDNIQVGLIRGRGRSWSITGRNKRGEVFECYDENGRKVNSSLFIRVTLQTQVMAPSLQNMPIVIP